MNNQMYCIGNSLSEISMNFEKEKRKANGKRYALRNIVGSFA